MSIGPLLVERYERITRLFETGERITGVPSGLYDLDRLTGGFQPGQLAVIVGGYSIGKSSFLLSVGANVSVRGRIPTAVFNPDSSASEAADRLIAIESQISSTVLEHARHHPDDWPRLTASCEALAEAPLSLNDNPALTSTLLDEILCAQTGPPRLVLVDDLHTLLEPDAPVAALVAQLAELSRIASTHQMALVTALLPPSAAREPETGRPLLHALRRDGLVGAADLVLLLDRDEQALPEEPNAALADVIVARNRNGRTDTIRVTFHRQCGRFTDLREAGSAHLTLMPRPGRRSEDRSRP